MDGYLLDTCVLSALLDPGKPNHNSVRNTLGALEDAAPKYVSVISLAELRFGVDLSAAHNHKRIDEFENILSRANTYESLKISKHTAGEYGILKAKLAIKYLSNSLRQKGRTRWIEDWQDKATGKLLQIDENDLWLSAQAIERNLILLTTETQIHRIRKASPTNLHIETISTPP